MKWAVFTIVKNEADFLPFWLKYYSMFLKGEDIYILDDGSTDGSIKKTLLTTKYNIISVSRKKNMKVDSRFKGWEASMGYQSSRTKGKKNIEIDLKNLELAKEMQKDLLKKYDYVLYNEPDEIMIADPKYFKDFKEYMSKLKGPSVAAINRSIIHRKEVEPPIDWDGEKGIFEQRMFWFEEPIYGKTVLSRVPLNWTPGFHFLEEDPAHNPPNGVKQDPHLILLHLNRVDYDICEKRRKRKESKDINSWPLYWPHKNFRDWYYNPICKSIDLIPNRFRSVY